MSKKIFRITAMLSCFIILAGCNKFHVTRLLQSVGYNANECDKRDWTHHRAPYDNGANPGRSHIQARSYRCRIERVCVGKSEEENKKCKKDAGNYWGFTEDNEVYKIFKKSDDQFDAICTLNRSPWNLDLKGCSSKWHPQENYSTNPYWDKESKTYILPQKIVR